MIEKTLSNVNNVNDHVGICKIEFFSFKKKMDGF